MKTNLSQPAPEATTLLGMLVERTQREVGSAANPNHDGANNMAAGAGVGAVVGGGVLAALGLLAIPGANLLFTAGWLASGAAGALAGAMAGGAAGGLLGALKEGGQPENAADVRSGGVGR